MTRIPCSTAGPSPGAPAPNSQWGSQVGNKKFQRPTPPKTSYDAGEKSQETKYITLLKISVLFPFNALVKHFNQQIID